MVKITLAALVGVIPVAIAVSRTNHNTLNCLGGKK